MSISDEFFLSFPSYNENSKENIRNRRITEDCINYLTKKQYSPISPKKKGRLDFRQRRSQLAENVITNYRDEPLQSPIDEILSVEERNRWENDRKLEQKKIYLQVLEKQIEEQQLKKTKERERRKQEEQLFEDRYNRQIQQQIQELRQQRPEKIVKRISLSENENERYNHQRTHHAPVEPIAVAAAEINPSTRSEPSTHNNNKVYRYFSKSAKKDSELFNYKNLFEDIISDYRQEFHYGQPNHAHVQPIKKSLSESKLCPHPQAECTRCRKKLDIQCIECNTPASVDKVIGLRSKAMKTSKSSHILKDQTQQNEYNEHDLPISKNQQVVIYRPSDQHMPYSFNNMEKESHYFDHDTLEDLKKYSEQKLANYKKNYGSLRGKRTMLTKDMTTSSPGMVAATRTRQSLQKDKVSSLNRHSTGAVAKEAKDNVVSELDDIFHRAQITTITQVGLAKKHLAEAATSTESH